MGAAAALLALVVSGCSAPATQTGGGTARGSAESAAPTAKSSPATVKLGTTADSVATGWMAGTAKPSLPAGSEGKVDVVASGPIKADAIGSVTLPVAVRNNTADTITSIEVSGAAMDKSGMIVGSGRSQGLSPASVPPGGVSLGYVYFGSKVPATADLEFTVASKPLEGKPYFRDLKVNQANAVGAAITGKATNTSEDTLHGPFGVHITCFDQKGALLNSQGGFASPSADLAEGQSVTFQVSLYGKPCPSFLLGVSGYGPR